MALILDRGRAQDRALLADLARETGSRYDPLEEEKATEVRLWVARDALGSPALGFLLARDVADETELLHLAVLREARRRGVGARLLGAVVGHARTEGKSQVVLEVRADNAAALALYEGAGFHRVATRPFYYQDGGRAIMMAIDLSAPSR